jgi:ubiquinone/menaquinone biosynthesis C-methylase UbiE
MKTAERNKICSVENAHALDLGIRKLVHHPQKILKPYIKEGMSVLDVGCGPGFFSIEMAKMLGGTGKLVAADLQEGMLRIVKKKISGTDLQKIIEFHQCLNDKIGLTQEFDFILVFYMLHEVPDQTIFLKELYTLLKPEGKVLLVEPKFHVTEKDFNKSIDLSENIGFEIIESPKVFFSRSVVMNKKRNIKASM